MKNKTILSLNRRLDNVFKGKSFDEWCENVIDIYSENVIPPNLHNLLEKRRIQNILVSNNISFPAKIKKDKDSFVIYINKRINWSSSTEYRYYIAHEIAHTFQYDLQDKNPTELTSFLPGTIELEFFCNRIARSILMPRKTLIPFLKIYNSIDDNNFSIKEFNKLSKKFNVDHKITLQRIFNDLNYFKKIVLLRFIKFADTNEWNLIERYLSNEFNYDKRFFIPYLNKNKSIALINRLPSCGKKLNKMLDNFDKHLKINQEVKTSIDTNSLDEVPLKTFIKNFKNAELNVVIISKVKSNKDVIINLLFSLDEKHVAQHFGN
jgi:Zn-dependent peptidase ImmA (M78 family)